MNIKARLSVQFTFIVASLLLFFSVIVYFFSYSSQLSKFRESILESAQNTAILLIDVVEIDSTLLKKIHQSTFSLEKEEIVITRSDLSIIYSNQVDFLTDVNIQRHALPGKVNYFSINEKDGVCYRHAQNKEEYYVFVMAFDKNRYLNLQELKIILFWGTLISMLLSVFLSYLFANRAIHPISKIIGKMQTINSSRLSQRLDEGNKQDEIARLAMNFNQMLSKLEIAFKNQQEFVSNASHELRTPLTVMIAETDYILSRERSNAEYEKQFKRLVIDLKGLNTMLNNLLDLAQINPDNPMPMSPIRIDEVLYQCIQQVKAKYTDRKIVFKMEYPENSNDLLIKGNAGLLAVAFKNLIENSCKFSTQDIEIELIIDIDLIHLLFTDKGIGIPEDEIEHIYDLFRRASNATFKGGFGIGLALVKRIIDLHNANLQVQSIVNTSTRFKLSFHRMV